MSDSDDTDVLLLIPPDFFNIGTTSASTPASLPAEFNFRYQHEYRPSSDHLSALNESLGLNSYKSSIPTMSGLRSAFGTTGNYGFQTEGGGYLYYSTPIKGHLGGTDQNPPQPNSQFMLNEIDQFLQVGNKPSNQSLLPLEAPSKSPENSLIDLNSISVHDYPSLTASDFNGFSSKTAVPQKPPRKEMQASTRSSISTRPPLLSLNEIWNNNATGQESSKLQEERLRRQHCERNIQALQAKLLEYEQKIAVAVDVDKEKEAIIGRLEEDVVRQNRQLHDLELKHTESQEKLLQENVEIKNKNLFLEKELSETIAVVRKLQDKNEALESKVESLTSANRDVTDVHKNQLRDLEIRLANSKDAERSLKDQLGKLRKQSDQLKDELEAERKKSEDANKLRGDFASLKVKTDNLSKKFSDINAQNESLKEQIKDLKAQVDSHLEEKKKLIKELDVQRLSLKKYYQAQLEDVVADKLKEFQKQLTSVEEQLKSEAKRKERLIAERAIKQIELINQTNEQEIKLLNEKCNEQESLYRLQLTNSSKTIHELQEKLESYQNRRADIAEQLHSIMETQWQKALEVLTSPATATDSNEEPQMLNRFNRLSVDHIDKDQLDGVRVLKGMADKESCYQSTPVSSKPTGMAVRNSTLPRDLLHNYIELLLEKSPSDLKGLEGVLASGKKEPRDKSVAHSNLGKMTNNAMSTSVSSLNQLSRTLGKTPRPWK
ncbi:AAEL006125-PA [Aedes aegypti]|uniref:AAEL006125-PA n=2 Tax=Aedes aegypti TaxID=7159 RepID=A0A1S4FCM6_AEDAE|nr:golgin subfamily A member 4 [Aedes aegypti]EAT42317.1 AAEL006125-PA [Aedes aegypti]